MERTRVDGEKEINSIMTHRLETFLEDLKNLKEDAVAAAELKAKQADELERLKTKHETELEALQDRHDRENDRQKGQDEKEMKDDQIKAKRDAERKANEEWESGEDTMPDLEEGKLVADVSMILDTILKKLKTKLETEVKKNPEKGVGMINTVGAFVNHKVTDKSQTKGKLFLKFGDVHEVKQDKDIKDREGTQPAKYYAKDADGDEMSKSTKQARARHFAQKKSGPAPGDATAETKPSKHTKKFKKMFGESEVEESAEKSLAKKADKSGIAKGILQQVYNRGVAAWKTGHRPGTTPEQWGHARVNSFITKGKGTWGGADKDLAKKAGG